MMVVVDNSFFFPKHKLIWCGTIEHKLWWRIISQIIPWPYIWYRSDDQIKIRAYILLRTQSFWIQPWKLFYFRYFAALSMAYSNLWNLRWPKTEHAVVENWEFKLISFLTGMLGADPWDIKKCQYVSDPDYLDSHYSRNAILRLPRPCWVKLKIMLRIPAFPNTFQSSTDSTRFHQNPQEFTFDTLLKT